MLLALFRVREAALRWRVPVVNRLLRQMQMTLGGVELGNDITLGAGVYFIHSLGTVVGGRAQIGARVRFMGNNTVGAARDDGAPVIEEDVEIGCGARILGPVRIGARAVIGANAVVLTDIPADHVAVGIPARILPKRDARLAAPVLTLASGPTHDPSYHQRGHRHVRASRTSAAVVGRLVRTGSAPRRLRSDRRR
jgi:serine O-acetyltransferase